MNRSVVRTRGLPAVLAVVLASGFAAPSRAQAPPVPEEQIREMIRILENATDPAIRRTAMDALLQAGPAAVPHLEARIRERGAEPFVQALRLLVPIAGTGGEPPDPKPPAPDPTGGPAKGRGLTDRQIDQYLLTKYMEAVRLYRDRKYAAALEIADAVIALEPAVSFRDQVRELRALCRRLVFQGETLAAELSLEKTIYELGDPIPVGITLRNRSLTSIRFGFGEVASQGAATPGRVLIEWRATVHDPVSGRISADRSDLVTLPPDLVLPPGGSWNGKWTLKTADDRPTDPKDPSDRFYRTYEIQARVFVPHLSVGEGTAPHWLAFNALSVAVLPKGCSSVAEKPLEALGRAMDKGTVNDVFLAACLIRDPDRDKAVELLMKALRDMQDPTGRQIIMNCLRYLTGQELPLEEKAWTAWWEKRRKER